MKLNEKVIFLIVFFLMQFIWSQQESYYSLYQYNMNVVNPAFAGTQDGDLATLIDRNQWLGVEGAPRTLALSYSIPRDKNIGIGVSIVSDKVFIEQQTFAYLDVSYKLQVEEKTTVFLGLKVGGNFYKSDALVLKPYSDTPDPNQISISSFNPNIGIGIYAKRDNHWFSFSIPRLLNNKRSDDLAVTAKDRIHVYIAGGSEFPLFKYFTVKPSLMLRKVKGLPLSADITNFVSYQNKYDLGISFRTKAALSIMSVINVYDGFNIGYAYEVPTANRLSEMRVKTHEIMLMFNIDSIKKSKSVSESTEE
jgi:type IX secretion system PorP/SprF family membrane protein